MVKHQRTNVCVLKLALIVAYISLEQVKTQANRNLDNADNAIVNEVVNVQIKEEVN